MTLAVPQRNSSSFGLALAAIAPVLAASLSGWVTNSEITGWYAGIVKPSFNPPNWVFGPVWTALYALMAYAFWRILRMPAGTNGRNAAIIVFLVQIALNALWSFAFFGAHSPAAGLIVIALLWLAIVATILTFAKLDSVAAWCLAPYIAWVSFAAVLNLSIWRLN
jgi:translocator protein